MSHGELTPGATFDRAALEVAALVEQGWCQIAASRMVFADLPPHELPTAPAWDAEPAAWSTWVHRSVATLFAPLRRLVGLPLPDLTKR